MKPAALITVAAALLTLLAPLDTAAAPNSKSPVTVETARTYSYTVTNWLLDKYNRVLPASVDHVFVAMPNKTYAERKSVRDDFKLHKLWYADGKTAGVYDFLNNKYQVMPLSYVVGDDPHYHLPPGKAAQVLLEGKPALLYTQVVKHSNGTATVARAYFDVRTHKELLDTGTVVGGKHDGKLAFKFVYSDWKLNPKLSPSLFTFVPPPGAKLQVAEQEEDGTAKFLKPGTPAPDFTAYDGNGKAVHLSDYAGKVVLLDFWATWCGPCQESLPDTNTIAKKYAGQVVTLGVNVWDEQSAFANWLPLHKNLDSITFISDSAPMGKDVASQNYGVVAIPSQYVIGKDGKVAAAFCVASPDELTAALDKAIAAVPVTP